MSHQNIKKLSQFNHIFLSHCSKNSQNLIAATIILAFISDHTANLSSQAVVITSTCHVRI